MHKSVKQTQTILNKKNWIGFGVCETQNVSPLSMDVFLLGCI